MKHLVASFLLIMLGSFIIEASVPQYQNTPKIERVNLPDSASSVVQMASLGN